MTQDTQPITRTYQVAWSVPQFPWGRCAACMSQVDIDPAAPFDDDTIGECGHCGAKAPRRRLILEALALIDTVTWSLLCSDVYIFDQTQLAPGELVSYNVTFQPAKWQHHEVRLAGGVDARYSPSINFYDDLKFGFLSLLDSKASSEPTESPPPRLDVNWYRFGISESGKVPAWRQSLFGAATLVTTHPAAAIVLVAAGFEAFFLETMRVSWGERQLEMAAFDRLNDRNPPISGLIGWLPSAVGHRSLQDASPGLHSRWETLVNRRRNEVVHQANVDFTTADAQESMRAALECIAAIDPAGLVRPHAYYLPR